jgi:hypothetical protein
MGHAPFLKFLRDAFLLRNGSVHYPIVKHRAETFVGPELDLGGEVVAREVFELAETRGVIELEPPFTRGSL